MTELPDLVWTRSRDFRAGPFRATLVSPQGWTALSHALAAERPLDQRVEAEGRKVPFVEDDRMPQIDRPTVIRLV